MITISPGHWHIGTGTSDIIDEVIEARKVVDGVAWQLTRRGIKVHKVVDTTSNNQQENLHYLVRAHNATTRQIDVSIHFNAVAGRRQEGIGTEVLFRHDTLLATHLVNKIAEVSSLKNRGAKRRLDIAFLNGVSKRAVLIEICFVNSVADVALYQQYEKQICKAIADVLMQEVT